LLPSLTLSLSGFPLSFPFFFKRPALALLLRSVPLLSLFVVFLSPAFSCTIGLASERVRECPPLFLENCLRRGVSLVCGELVKARGLAIILRQAAAALRVEGPENALRVCASLVGGEFVKASGLAIVLRQPVTTSLVGDPEIVLRPRTSPIGEELVEVAGPSIV
jgi:hypothetical protein